MFKRFSLTFLGILLFSIGEFFAQGEPILLNNPSFEDMPRPSMQPRGWYDCGYLNFPLESPPDIHPVSDEPSFGVDRAAYDGKTYLGMVVRENESWESIAQRLVRPLEAGKCYSFSIHIATSGTYLSSIRGGSKEVSFTEPLKLRIWGGSGLCGKDILLAESSLIKNKQWKEYSFKFEPTRTVKYLILEAFFKTPTLSPPNGNILLDNASPITPLPCDEELPLVKKPDVDITSPSRDKISVAENAYNLAAKVFNVSEKREILLKVNGRNTRKFTFNPSKNSISAKLKLRKGVNRISVRAANSAGNAKDETTIVYEPPADPTVHVEPEPEPQSETERQLGLLKKDETMKVDELSFDVDSYEITEASKPSLDEVYAFLDKNKNVKVEIGGHTNRYCDTSFCNELSTNRAKAVVSYLVRKGIRKDRLTYRGYGKTKPITFSSNAKLQKKNQRVEVKIISIGS